MWLVWRKHWIENDSQFPEEIETFYGVCDSEEKALAFAEKLFNEKKLRCEVDPVEYVKNV